MMVFIKLLTMFIFSNNIDYRNIYLINTNRKNVSIYDGYDMRYNETEENNNMHDLFYKYNLLQNLSNNNINIYDKLDIIKREKGSITGINLLSNLDIGDFDKSILDP